MITPTEGTVCAAYLYGTTTGRTARSIYTVPWSWSRIQGHLYMAATYRISSGMGRWG